MAHPEDLREYDDGETWTKPGNGKDGRAVVAESSAYYQ